MGRQDLRGNGEICRLPWVSRHGVNDDNIAIDTIRIEKPVSMRIIMNRHNGLLLVPAVFSCLLVLWCEDISSINLPESMYYSLDGAQLLQGGVISSGFYDETILRTIDLTFSQADYWQQLTKNYKSEVNIPADLTMDGVKYPVVGVRFKGQTSYNMTGTSLKKSFNISIDFADSTLRLMGYKTLNLNNSFSDPSIMREVLFFNICRKYFPCPKANFIKLTINGQNWGIYDNAQQLNSDFIKEWFFSNHGAHWKALMNMGLNQQQTAGQLPAGQLPTGQVPAGQQQTAGQIPAGQQPTAGGIQIFAGGNAALTWLGSDIAAYEKAYELKSSDVSEPWQNLVKTCDILNNIPLAQLADTLNTVLAVDRCLWFVAVENIFTDEDSYLTKGADYHFYYEAETGRIHPLEYDGNETLRANDVSLSPVYGETIATRPLIRRLLSVPEIRQRYLAHVRTVINESLDWSMLKQKIEAYKALIGSEVIADTKKMTTNAAFTNSLVDFQNFVEKRRNYLSSFSEINIPSPEISSVTQKTIYQVSTVPSPGTAVRVTARIGGAVGIENVILHYAEGLEKPFSHISMFDDGLHGDGSAGDGVFGGEIPPLPIGGEVRYYIEARASDKAYTATFAPAGAEHDVYVCKVTAPVADSTPVVINEVMSSNQTIIQDPQGEYEDWIELLNVSGREIDLSGMYLSDNENNLRKWAFSAGTTLAPGSFLVIWADEDGNDAPGLHANFKLSASGESVMLVDTDKRGNVILDSVTFGTQNTDVSYGRYPDGAGVFKLLPLPTPGLLNAKPTGVTDGVLPNSFSLKQNYPNPFNSGTVIGFYLPENVAIDLSIYNFTGQKVVTLARGTHHAGTYQLHWNGRGEAGKELASGIYLYRLQAGVYSKMHQMLLLK